MVVAWYNRLKGTSTLRGVPTPIGGAFSGRLVVLVEGEGSLNMGEIGNIILFLILLSTKLQFYNNLFFLLFKIFVASHFIFSCDDSLNTIFFKNFNVALFRFSSNS